MGRKRRRGEEVWALQGQVKKLQEELVEATAKAHEGSLEAVMEEIETVMKAYGDTQWHNKKAQLPSQLWLDHYDEPCTTLQEEFPILADFIHRLVLGEYRTKQLQRSAVTEDRRLAYDHDKSLQVEGILASVLRCRNQKATCFVSEVLGILQHSHNVPAPVEQCQYKFSKGHSSTERHRVETLKLMMAIKPKLSPRIISVQLDNNHFRCRRSLEHLNEDGDKTEAENIDTVTWMVIHIDESVHPCIQDIDFESSLYDKPFDIVEGLLDPSSFELLMWKRKIWARYTTRILEGEAFMRVRNKPDNITRVDVQACIVGVTGSLYRDNVTCARVVQATFWARTCTSGARTKCLVHA